MSVLLMDKAVRNQIQELVVKATATPIDPDESQHRAKQNLAEYKQWLWEYTIDIPMDFRVTFTHEKQPIGLCRHIAISVSDKLPNPYIVIEICKEFGMGDLQFLVNQKENNSAIMKIWLEKFDNGMSTVNILQLVTPDKAKYH